MIDNPLIDPLILAHANLKRAIDEHGGTKKSVSYNSGLNRYRMPGVGNDASWITEITNIAIEFANPASIGVFLYAARPVIMKWLEVRKDRSIEIQSKDFQIKVSNAKDLEKAISAAQDLSTKKNDSP